MSRAQRGGRIVCQHRASVRPRRPRHMILHTCLQLGWQTSRAAPKRHRCWLHPVIRSSTTIPTLRDQRSGRRKQVDSRLILPRVVQGCVTYHMARFALCFAVVAFCG